MGTAKNNAAYRFAEMPEVDGAMIVESGSNTDGEWTRWADGTQQVSVETTPLNATALVGGVYISGVPERYTWTYPKEFIFTTGGTASVFSNDSSSTYSQSAKVDHSSVVDTYVSFIDYGSNVNTARCYATMFGRWK